MSGVDVGLARWAHVTRGSCCAALFLLSSPFHTVLRKATMEWKGKTDYEKNIKATLFRTTGQLFAWQ